MTAEEMVGIIDFDVTETVYSASDFSKPVATMNLYHVLYNYVKMEDGHSLISKTHQQCHMGSVNIVISNIPEAETMVAMMNKQLPAYMKLYHEYQGLDKGFIRKLLTIV